jgi:Tfp pilus assembly protein PilE
MGQQQLLLIVLGVIVVGIAVAIGITIFTESAAQANFDAVMSDMLRIASNAQQWYMKPSSLGGGGRTFANVSLPNLNMAGSNANGIYTLGSIQAGSFNITGVGKEDGDKDGTPITIALAVYPDSVSSTPVITSR